MKQSYFYTIFFVLGLILIALGTLSVWIIQLHPALSGIFFIQFINMLGCFILVGIGFGIPVVLLATVLGWVQFLLLVTGTINPHLAREGLFNVLTTLFSKL
jgi:hypothetical protein